MPDQDPIDRLDRFAADIGAGALVSYDTRDARDARGARARGDRLRRRRRGLVATAAAALVAAVAIPLAVGGGDDDADLVTGDPVRSPALSRADLMTDDDTVYSDGADWTVEPGSAREDDAFRCARAGLDTLGATRRLSQRYLLDGQAPDAGDTPLLTETVAAFPDAATAAAAMRTVDGWFTSCAEQVSVYGDVDVPSSTTPVDLTEVGGDVEGRVVTMTFGPAPRDVDPAGDSSFFAELGVVRNGERIAVLSQTVLGQDYNFASGATPVARMLGPAARRLAAGGGSEDGDTAASLLPADFDLSDGLLISEGDPTGSGDPEGSDAPFDGFASTTFCGQSAGGLESGVREVEAAQIAGPYTEQRQVLVYADVDAAVSAAESFVGLAEECPRDEVDGVTRQTVVVPDDSRPDVDRLTVVSSTLGGDTSTPAGVDVLVVARTGGAVLIARGSRDDATETAAVIRRDLLGGLAGPLASLVDTFG